MVIIALTLLGLCLGSFVNALVWRLHQQLGKDGEPKKLSKAKQKQYSIMMGRSMCPHCRHELAARDLVPVFSWLSVRGKCRYCKQSISAQYPILEAITAAAFVVSYVTWPLGWGGAGMTQFGFWLIFLTGFMALTLYDLKWYLLPNRILFPLIGLALIQVAILSGVFQGGFATLLEAWWGFAIGGGIFWVLFQLSNGTWIGGGDVKLGWLLGLIVGGPAASLLLIFLASLIGVLVTLPLMLAGKAGRKTQLPFGPFLIAAAVIVQLFGNGIIDWYRQLIGI